MAQIAEQAGLQQSSIYYWFRSKSDILASILERVNRVPLAIVERERAAAGPVAVRLLRLVREDVLALCGFPFDINEIHRLARRRRRTSPAYWEERRRLDDEVEALVAEGVASGELRPVDARLAARTLLAGDEATQNWFRSLDRVAATPPRRSPTTWPRSPCAPSSPTRRRSTPSPPRPADGAAVTARREACQRSRSAANAACCVARKASMSSASAARKAWWSARRNVVGSISSVELARALARPAGRAARRRRPGGSGSGRRCAAATARSKSSAGAARRGSTPARCARRTGSRPGPPCRRCTGRRRRCRPRSPASTCGPGCTSW